MEDEVPDVDLVGALDDQRAGDLATVHVGPVGALQVDDDVLAVLQHDPGVPLRHVSLGQDDVVALDPTDRHLGLVEFQPPLFSALLGNDDCKHYASGNPLYFNAASGRIQ
jgi:hypothetical protein